MNAWVKENGSPFFSSASGTRDNFRGWATRVPYRIVHLTYEHLTKRRYMWAHTRNVITLRVIQGGKDPSTSVPFLNLDSKEVCFRKKPDSATGTLNSGRWLHFQTVSILPIVRLIMARQSAPSLIQVPQEFVLRKRFERHCGTLRKINFDYVSQKGLIFLQEVRWAEGAQS